MLIYEFWEGDSCESTYFLKKKDAVKAAVDFIWETSPDEFAARDKCVDFFCKAYDMRDELAIFEVEVHE